MSNFILQSTLVIFSSFNQHVCLLQYTCIQVRAITGRSRQRLEVKTWGQVWVPSRFMRKIVCGLRLNKVSRQWRRRPEPPPSASCSCTSYRPTGYPPRGGVSRRPASGRNFRQGTFPPRGFCGGSHGSAARSRCWYGCASSARLGKSQ